MFRLSVVVLLALPLLAGCAAVSSLSNASAELDAYTLSPAERSDTATAGRRHLVVELPSAAGALATDRILVKPEPFQAQYLPDGRWSEPAPELVQTLLVGSFQNLGGFGLVGRTGAGLMPDYTLMTELQEFQAEPTSGEGAPMQFTIKVTTMMTIIRETDRSVVASRRFEATRTVTSEDTQVLVAGFDQALRSVLEEAVVWVVRQAG